MSKFWTVLLIGGLFLGMSGCTKDDIDDIRKELQEHGSRLTSLEEWQQSVNTNIASLQGLISALEDKDYVTGVTSLEDGTGYVISFLKSGNMTIKHGEKGETGVSPVISVKQDDNDGKYYWTVNGQWLLDGDNKIPVTGEKGETGDKGADAVAPQVRINAGTNEWEISTDGGTNWTTTGVKATGDQGDAIFAKDGVDNTHEDYVVFTLADGTAKIKLPKYQELYIKFSDDSYDTFYISETANEIELVLPSSLTEKDYTSLVATVTSSEGFAADIATRSAATSGWSVKIIQPTFTEGVLSGNAKVKLSLPENKTDYKALLKVTVIDTKGQEHSASRIVWYQGTVIIDNPNGSLSGLVTDPATVEQLSVIGTLTDSDFQFIREKMNSLEVLDLSRATITKLPQRALAFYQSMNLTSNSTLHTVILPEGLTTIGNSAFAECTRLEYVNIPSTVTTLGRWMFENSTKVASVIIPNGVTEIPASCFYKAGLTSIEIPTNVTSIGGWAFEGCPFTDIVIPSSVKSIGSGVFGCFDDETPTLRSVTIKTGGVTEIPADCFIYQVNLTTVSLPDDITSIGSDAFCLCPLQVGGGKLVLPSQLKTVGPRAFSSSNSNITSIAFPEGLEEIGESAFASISKIKEVTLPASLKKLADCAFCWSTSSGYVEKLTFKGSEPPQVTYMTDYDGNLLSPNVSYMQQCKVYVPATAIETYKASVWFTGTDAYDKPGVYPKGQLYFNADNLSAITE